MTHSQHVISMIYLCINLAFKSAHLLFTSAIQPGPLELVRNAQMLTGGFPVSLRLSCDRWFQCLFCSNIHNLWNINILEVLRVWLQEQIMGNKLLLVNNVKCGFDVPLTISAQLFFSICLGLSYKLSFCSVCFLIHSWIHLQNSTAQ